MPLSDQDAAVLPPVKARIETRTALLAAVPVHRPERRPTYIRVADIPPPWRDEFLAAIKGRPQPMIPSEHRIAYAFDWKDWVRGTLRCGAAGPSRLVS